MSNTASFIRWFSDINLSDVPLVGGKNASLGELYRELAEAGVRVPNAVAIAVTGRSVGGKIASGPARVIPNAADLRLFQPGEVCRR